MMMTAIGHAADGTVSPRATSSATPDRPIVRPTIVRADGREPRTHSINVSQNGSVATSSAAMPDESRCSDHARAA